MKSLFFPVVALVMLNSAVFANEWTPMFNGRNLAGWKSSEAGERQSGVFTVKDGELVVSGGRAHLFYTGADGKASFRNFEFKTKVKTTPGSNSGIYFHTAFQESGWPSNGYECQVNASHTDRKKSGGLYAVADVMDNPPHKDNEWFDYVIKVEGRRIVIKINGKITTDWTQPDDWDPSKSLTNMPGRKLGEGTIALQGHDPKSVIHYKELFIRALP